MRENPRKFGELLTYCLQLIKARERKNLDVIQDELGYLIDKSGGEYIRYLRRGNLPTDLADLEKLISALVRRCGAEPGLCKQLLASAGHPAADELTTRWYGSDRTIASKDEMTTSDAALQRKPFVAGPPIQYPNQFFGRQQELKRIFAMWRKLPLEHVALIGKRRSGKTSLLHYLKSITLAADAGLRPGQRHDWLTDPQHYRWIMVDFLDPRLRQPEPLLQHLLAGFGIPVHQPCSLDLFLDLASDHNWSQPCIVLMDEIGAALDSAEIEQALWWALRSLISSPVTNGKLAFLVAGHAPPDQLAKDAGKVSPFFNMFNSLNLGPFTEAEAYQLIESSPLPFAADDVHWIVEKSGRWPLLLQILCQERLHALEENDVSDDWQETGLQRFVSYRHLLE